MTQIKTVFSHPSTETQSSRSSVEHRAEKNRGITIATCNIEGVKTNAPFLQFLCDNFDIVFLQEHWMWEFQKHELSIITKNKDNFTRCSDASDPLSGFSPPRGKGGISILRPVQWRSR